MDFHVQKNWRHKGEAAVIAGFLVHRFGVFKALSVWWCFWRSFVDGIWDAFKERWWVVAFLVHMQWEVTLRCIVESVCRSAGEAWRLKDLRWFCWLHSLSLSHFHFTYTVRITCDRTVFLVTHQIHALIYCTYWFPFLSLPLWRETYHLGFPLCH